MMEYRIKAHIEVLRRRQKRLVEILADWHGGKDPGWAVREHDALSFAIFALEDIYDAPESHDSYGIEWVKKEGNDILGHDSGDPNTGNFK